MKPSEPKDSSRIGSKIRWLGLRFETTMKTGVLLALRHQDRRQTWRRIIHAGPANPWKARETALLLARFLCFGHSNHMVAA
ncbi:MAG: hypothetical protein RLN69_00520 [Woeseiaceae bacterium]